MTPTPHAEQLAGPVRRALDELQLALEPDVFSPATAERSFVVALDNFGAIALDAPVDRFRSQTLVVDYYVVVTRFSRAVGPAALQPVVGSTAKKRDQDFASLYVRERNMQTLRAAIDRIVTFRTTIEIELEGGECGSP